ncbi:MAG: DUF6049 family protein [Sciscionella sp.]
MKRLFGMVATMLLTLLLASPFTGTAAADSQPGNGTPHRIQLNIDHFSPQVVKPGTTQVTVTGTVTNVGDRDIHEVEVRLQSGDPVQSSSQLRTALTGTSDPERAHSLFQRLSDELRPGQTVPLRLRVPLSVLQISEPGVYPLLVNVNGRPDYGGTARLAAVSLLLPVTGPGMSATHSHPVPLSLLWPIADDHPRVIRSTSGGHALFSDDRLARSLATGGRLYGLLDSVRLAAQRDPGVLDALCFAVDPDLLNTVETMARGYRVRTASGGTIAGKGGEAAISWLAELRGITKGHCVISLPYADADLVALARQGVVDLEKQAIDTSVVHRALPDATLLQNVVWPIDGTLDQRTLSDLVDSGTTTVLTDPGVLGHSDQRGPLPLSGTTSQHRALAIRLDPLISAGLGGLPARDGSLGSISGTDQVARSEPASTVAGVAAQNGIAAMIYRTRFADGAQLPSLIAPPHRWNVTEDQLSAFLSTMQRQFDSGAAVPRAVSQLIAASPASTPVPLNYSPEAAAAEISPSITTQIAKANAKQRDLIGAMSRDDAAQIEPATITAPIRDGLLRATSASWRNAPDGAGQLAVDEVTDALDAITGKVAVDSPGRTISMASNDSPVPITISNGLPVGMTVQIKLSRAAGLQINQVPDQMIPARSQRTVYVKSKVLRAGQFSVDVALTTPSGITSLGSPVRVHLSSTTYGPITLAITGTAFGLLLLLSGRRVYRRVRAARADGNRQTVPDREAGLDARDKSER